MGAISRGWQGMIPAIAPPPGDVLGLKERNIHDWWSPADDPFSPERCSEEHTCTKGTGGGASGSNAQQVDHQPVFL